MESYGFVCNGTLCPKMTSARNGFVWSDVGDINIMSFASGHKDALYGLDNARQPILRNPEERKKKRYGISHHMCIHDWNHDDTEDENGQEIDNHLINVRHDSSLETSNGTGDLTDDLVDLTDETDDATISSDDNTNKSDDITNRITDVTKRPDKVFINGHRKLCATQSEFFLSETREECEDSIERFLPPFFDRYSRFFQSMADVETSTLLPNRQLKQPGKRAKGPKPPIAPKPVIHRTQSDSKFLRPTLSKPLRPRSKTSESELENAEEENKKEDALNKNVVSGFTKVQPAVKPVKPPLPAPRKSVGIGKDGNVLHTPPPRKVPSSNIKHDESDIKPEKVPRHSDKNQDRVQSNCKVEQPLNGVALAEGIHSKETNVEESIYDETPDQKCEDANQKPLYGDENPDQKALNGNDVDQEPIYGNDGSDTEPIYDAAADEPIYSNDETIDNQEPLYGNESTDQEPIYGNDSADQEQCESADQEPIYGNETADLNSNEPIYSNDNDEEVTVKDKSSTPKRYGVIEPVKDTSSPDRTSNISRTSASRTGSRHSANLEQIMCASPRISANIEDKQDSHGRYSLHLENLRQAEVTTSSEDIHRVTNHDNITDINNELNDSFKEDLPSVPHHKRLERLTEPPPRAPRESVKNLHVPVRERAAHFDRIAAEIRRKSSSEFSSCGSSVSSTPPMSPRGSQQMSFRWEKELEMRLGVNRSRDSSMQSSSTSSRSGSSRTHLPMSRSMSSGSVFSDFSNDDASYEYLSRKDSNMPERCRIEREDLYSARIIRNMSASRVQEELYENIDELMDDEPLYDTTTEELEPNTPTGDVKGLEEEDIYAVYLDEDDLVRDYPGKERRRSSLDEYHSDGYHGDMDVRETVAEVMSKSSDELGDGPHHRPLRATQSISRRRRQAIRKNTITKGKGMKHQPQSLDSSVNGEAVSPLRHADSEPARRNRQEDDQVATATSFKSDGHRSYKDELYDEVTTLRKELEEESKKQSTDSPQTNEHEPMKSPESPRTKSRRTRESNSDNSFEFFKPLFLSSKDEKNRNIDRTNQKDTNLTRDSDSTKHLESDVFKSEKRSPHSYINVDGDKIEQHRKMSSDRPTSDRPLSDRPASDAVYDDVTLHGTSAANVVDKIPITTLTSFQEKLKLRQSLGNSMASESSTASYIDIEEEILSKGFSNNHQGAKHVSSNVKSSDLGSDTTTKEDEYDLLNETSVQEDEYDLLANVTTEQVASDEEVAIEKSSSSSKESGEDSDTIYANLTDEPPTPNRDMNFDDAYLSESDLQRDDKTASSYYDSHLNLKFGTDPDAPEIYERPDSTVSGNSYLELLEDFQTMDRDHASYYISDESRGGTLEYSQDNDQDLQPSPATVEGNQADDTHINASAYQDVHLLKSDIPCEPLCLPTPDEYRQLPGNNNLPSTEEKKKQKPVKSAVGNLLASEGINRQKSKFVNREPLFQIYQATQRISDPYDRPKSGPPSSPPPRLPRNLPSPNCPPPPPPSSTPPSLRRGPSGNVLPTESEYSAPQTRASVISESSEQVEGFVETVRKVSVTSSVLHRSYWCELREVVKSGVLQEMTDEEKKLQEAMFEVITSEASYLRSLNLVISHFMESPLLKCQMPTTDHHTLFSNIKSIRDASERLLLELEKRQEESVLIINVCDIVLKHLESDQFNCYAIYCANNQYQLRTLDRLKKKSNFANALQALESDPECQHLDIQSFLMLPFQRITRLPLLVSAILERIQRLRPQSEEEFIATSAFAAARTMAKKCDEETTKMERIEEVTLLARQMGYREGVKKMDISQHTTIIKRGHLSMVTMDSGRLGGAKRKIKKKKLVTKSVYILVFKDKVVIAKEKSKGFEKDKDKEQRSYKEPKEDKRRFEVIDWCQRNLVNVQVIDQNSKHKLPEGIPPSCNYIFVLTFIQNQQKKQMTYILSAASESELTRWMEAINPQTEGDNGERIYESWDCPQVVCVAPYVAKENDELTLQVNDRMDILTKAVDGLYKGMRVSDYASGWFPAKCVEEVVNEHVLARNLKQRHQILSKVDARIRLQMMGK